MKIVLPVQVDSDGDTLDFPAMISQLFEFLITLAGSSRFQPMLTQGLPQLIHLSLGMADSLPPFPCLACKEDCLLPLASCISSSRSYLSYLSPPPLPPPPHTHLRHTHIPLSALQIVWVDAIKIVCVQFK